MAFKRDEAYEDQGKFIAWLMFTFIWAVLAWLVLSLVVFASVMLIRDGLSLFTLGRVWEFCKAVFTSRQMVLFSAYADWYHVFSQGSVHSNIVYLPLLPTLTSIAIIIVGIFTNPHDYMPKIFGGGRMARYADIKKMGLFNGFVIVLGRFKGKLLKMPETLSALVVAPPGTGKTAGVVIPTILESPGLSLIVNDPKPELCYNTTGYRATIGPVFVINWGAEDDPEKGIYFPAWNPLSESCLPPLGKERDTYIESMVNVMVEEPKGGADPHWSKTGRNAMVGFLQFISSKCERARANDYFVARLTDGVFDKADADVLETYYADMGDPSALIAQNALKSGELTIDNYAPIGTWEGLPELWHGKEPCIAMILDWLNDTQMKIAADLKRRADAGDQAAMFNQDPMKDVLDFAVAECSRFGYSRRAVLEFTQLASTPDKERGSILSTALTGINIFKNSAVRDRTKFSDLSFKDIRGMRDPVTGEMKPISVYLSVNQVDARTLNVITGIFVELMSSYLISNPPNFVNNHGEKSGPFPVLFVLDEFPQMPKLAAVKDGPAVGRGQKVSYLLIGQDLGQISGQYGKDDLETIITTTAAKVILAQNNEQTAERFSKMIGSKTIEVASSSRTEGVSQQTNPFAANVSRSLQSSNVVGASSMMSLDMLKQYVLFQGYLNRPILADAPRWYLDKGMKKKCAMPTAPFVPYWVVAQREETDLAALKALMKDSIDEFDEEMEKNSKSAPALQAPKMILETAPALSTEPPLDGEMSQDASEMPARQAPVEG